VNQGLIAPHMIREQNSLWFTDGLGLFNKTKDLVCAKDALDVQVPH
jgi:hypothetical protein